MSFLNLLDLNAANALTARIKAELDKKANAETGKGLSSNDYTAAEKNKLASIAVGANNYTHPNSGISAGTYRSVTVNAQGHITGGTNPTTLADYGITQIEASKLTGTIDIDRLPQGALDKLVKVADDTARFKLTASSVQVGDSVKVLSTGKMYIVTDESKLNSELGYEAYTSGIAASVPWSGVTDKPTTFTPSSHNHEISNINGLQTELNSKSNTGHTHNYAGSSNAGGAANSVKNNLILKLNSGTTEGTNMFTFNGSTAKTIDIKPENIGMSVVTTSQIEALCTDIFS